LAELGLSLLHSTRIHPDNLCPAESAVGESICIPIEDAVAACNTVAYGPAGQVADVAAAALAGIKQGYLTGGDLLGSAVSRTGRDRGMRKRLEGGRRQVAGGGVAVAGADLQWDLLSLHLAQLLAVVLITQGC